MSLSIRRIVSTSRVNLYASKRNLFSILCYKDRNTFFWRALCALMFVMIIAIGYCFSSSTSALLQPSSARAQMPCNQSIETVALVNVQTDQEIRTLPDGYRIQLDNTNLSHLALVPKIQTDETDQANDIGIESLYYDLDGILFQIKNLPPYTLEAVDILNQAGGYIAANSYRVQVSAYSQNGATGEKCDDYTLYFDLQNFACADINEIPKNECDALVGFYYTTNGWQWKDNSGWLETGTPCSWYGITCAYTSGVGLQVSELSLEDNNLFGFMPDVMDNLPNLQKLDIARNHISAPLPPKLGELLALTHLDLSANRIVSALPAEWDSLSSQLQVLRLDNNALFGEVPLSYAELPDDVLLDLSHNSLQKNSADSQDRMSTRFPGWDQTQTVPVTNFSVSNVTATSAKLHWDPIPYRNPDHGGRYPVYYATSPYDSFAVAGSTVDKEADGYLLEGLTPGTKYYISISSYTPPHDIQLNEQFQSSPRDALSFTTTPGDGYDCTGITEIPYPECEALRAIYLETDGPHWIDNSGWLADDRPCSWYGITCHNGHVLVIDLTGNQLAGILPSRIGNLSMLEYLWLPNNLLHGPIPLELGLLDNVISIRLQYNQFTGQIPTVLNNLNLLEVLDLGYNQLEGQLPETLTTRRKLRDLSVSSNRLGGEIPTKLSRLTKLQNLELEYNMLTATESDLVNFLTEKSPTWQETQTVPVIEPTVRKLTEDTIELMWTPISYTADGGWYEIRYIEDIFAYQDGAVTGNITDEIVADSIQIAGRTADKKAKSFTLPSLKSDIMYQVYIDTYTPPHDDQQNALATTKILLITLTNNFDCSGVTTISEEECEALLDLYNAMGGDEWFNNNGWWISNDPCSWYGIRCRDGEIIALELGSNQLSGNLTEEIGVLNKLEMLLLDNNNLEGTLPQALKNLSNLQLITLNNNTLWTNDESLATLVRTISPGWENIQAIPPKNIQAIAENSQDILLAWEMSQGINQDGFYEITYNTSDNEQFRVAGVTVDISATEYRVTELTPGTIYNFRLRTYQPAVDALSDGVWSDYSPLITIQALSPSPCEQQPLAAGERCADLDDQEETVVLTADEFLQIKLPVQPSTGSFWHLVEDSLGADDQGVPTLRVIRQNISHTQESSDPVLGREVIEVYRIDPIAAGENRVRLEYRDPHGSVLDSYTLYINTVGTFDDISSPSEPSDIITSTVPLHPPDLSNSGSLARRARDEDSSEALGQTFSWCDHPDGNNYCPPIQDQAQCGSSWAFATASVMESLIQIKDNVQRDLSEQHLISCNNEEIDKGQRWGCRNGGWYAFDYYVDQPSFPYESGPGTVWEPSFLYSGEDLICKPGLDHHEQLSAWSYINPSNPFVVNYIDQIKDAIYHYGPVITSLCIGPQMQMYQSGVFQNDESQLCEKYDAKANHATIIVGWDDSEEAWIVRNSWGTAWGESGYVRIKYGTSNIGFATAYAIYDGAQGTQTPEDFTAEPERLADRYQMNLAWHDQSDDETEFQIFRREDLNSEWSLYQTVAADQTDFVDLQVRCNQLYGYRIQAITEEGSSNYSNIAEARAECAELRMPHNFTASAESQSITLEWENVNTIQDGTLILRWNPHSEIWQEIATVTGLAKRYEDVDVEFGESYFYIIRATSQGQLSLPTGYQSATVPQLQMSGPTNARAEFVAEFATDGTVELSWQDNSDNEDNYLVLRYNATTSQWQEIAQLAADTTTYLDSQAVCGEQSYHYQILAQKGTVSSPLSNLASTKECAQEEAEHTPTPTPLMTVERVAPTATHTSTAQVIDTPLVTPMVTPIATSTVTPITISTAISTATPAATLDMTPENPGVKTEIPDEDDKIYLPIVNK